MKNFVLFFLFFFAVYNSISAQDLGEAQKFIKKHYAMTNRFANTYIGKTGGKEGEVSLWPDTIYYNTKYKGGLLGAPTIPISFGRVEVKDGKYFIGSALQLGFGYTWFMGDFSIMEDDQIKISSDLFFGLAANIGLTAAAIDNNNISGSFMIGGFAGFKSISMMMGYDFITRSETFGLGTRIDLYKIGNNSFRAFGMVREEFPYQRHGKAVAGYRSSGD
jgi:hypothetical protein